MSTYQSIPAVVHSDATGTTTTPLAEELDSTTRSRHSPSPSLHRHSSIKLLFVLAGLVGIAVAIFATGVIAGHRSSFSIRAAAAAAAAANGGGGGGGGRGGGRGGSSHSTSRACTFDECFASSCDKELAPFTCLLHNGGPHGGCSATPWTLETCDDGCDLGGCDDLDIPDDADDCDVECTEEFCDQQQQRLCGPEVPFQCTSGSSTFGCSRDKYLWTLRVAKTSCGSCCNVMYC